jgi:DNA polymerase-3 subunit gamma/tau
VYAVLRSPVAEGSAAGRGGAASAAASDGGAAGAVDGGYVATNPFGEAAYGADLASRFAVPVAAAGAGSAPAASTAVAAPAPVLTAPAVSAPSLSTPIAPVGSFVPPVVGPAGPTTPEHVGPAPTPAEPGLLAPVVELVPQAGPVATIVEDVVASLPTPVAEAVTAPASVAEVVSVPAALAVPGGLSL